MTKISLIVMLNSQFTKFILLLLVAGSEVNFETLFIIPSGHYTDNNFCPITFKLHMQVVDCEKRNPIGLGRRVKGLGCLLHSCL